MRSRRRALKRLDSSALLVYVRNILQTVITLASASLGLIAALAWNEAIRATMKKILGPDDSISALYIYAIFATVVGIMVVSILSYLASKLGGEAVINREAEG
jgi:putative flippase GtrA